MRTLGVWGLPPGYTKMLTVETLKPKEKASGPGCAPHKALQRNDLGLRTAALRGVMFEAFDFGHREKVFSAYHLTDLPTSREYT